MTTITQTADRITQHPFQIAPADALLACEYLLVTLDYAAALQGETAAYENALSALQAVIANRLRTGVWYSPEQASNRKS